MTQMMPDDLWREFPKTATVLKWVCCSRIDLCRFSRHHAFTAASARA
jgi:hypothetical protein